MRLLIVEDEQELCDNIAKYFKAGGFEVSTASNLFAANDLITDNVFDVVLLDLNLPDGNGLSIIEEVKTVSFNTGIIIISAQNAVEDRIKGLELGADDYLTKPFHLSELNARINAVLRRNLNSSTEGIVVNEITINPNDKEVYVHGQLVKMTPKEYRLLYYFMINKNRVLSKAAICEYLLGEDVDWLESFDLVYSHLKNVRKKLEKNGSKDYIETMYGIGYKFSA